MHPTTGVIDSVTVASVVSMLVALALQWAKRYIQPSTGQLQAAAAILGAVASGLTQGITNGGADWQTAISAVIGLIGPQIAHTVLLKGNTPLGKVVDRMAVGAPVALKSQPLLDTRTAFLTADVVTPAPPGGRERYFATKGLTPVRGTWAYFQEQQKADNFGDGPHNDGGEAYGTLRDGTGVWAKIN